MEGGTWKIEILKIEDSDGSDTPLADGQATLNQKHDFIDTFLLFSRCVFFQFSLSAVPVVVVAAATTPVVVVVGQSQLQERWNSRPAVSVSTAFNYSIAARIPPGRVKEAEDEPKMAQDGPKMAPRGPKMAQHGPKMGPRWAQDGPKWAQDGPKRAQEGPRWPQDGPKMGPRRAQDGLKIGPKRPRNLDP